VCEKERQRERERGMFCDGMLFEGYDLSERECVRKRDREREREEVCFVMACFLKGMMFSMLCNCVLVCGG